MTRPEIDCEQALRLLAAHLDSELAGPESGAVEEHLERCRSCWSRAEFERRLKARLAELGDGPARPALEARIRGLLEGFASQP